MSNPHITIMFNAEIIVSGDEKAVIAAQAATNDDLAQIVKSRLGADHVVVSKKKVFSLDGAEAK